MTEQEILNTLDHSNDSFYCTFVPLGHFYSYLIDVRLNVFRNDNGNWAIAIERLGFNPREGYVALEIYYYGNCLENLEYYNNRPTSSYCIYPIDSDNFIETIDNVVLKNDAKYWLVRGEQVALQYTKQDYKNAGIELKEYEPNTISADEVAKLAVLNHRDLFRATDQELYKSIPKDLKKILVLDEWFHKDFEWQLTPKMTEDQLQKIYDFNEKVTGMAGLTLEEFKKMTREQEATNDDYKKTIWENNRPSSYETWQLIAKVIVSNDPTLYKPTLQPNTHWSNWLDSGSM
ncbi:MAG: hypothetical protein HC854_18065 [Flavobacterium sp.]|nr:hypothetical protein [Flavobacterium sp.]